MSYADEIFIKNCKEILKNGKTTPCRAHWQDGTQANTIHIFGVMNRYDLSKEFPIMTLRKTNLTNAIDELLWIWQKKSNNVHDLHSHIWDSWADKEGSIGKAYGYQIGKKYLHHSIKKKDLYSDEYLDITCHHSWYPSLSIRGIRQVNKKSVDIYMDQIDSVRYDIAHDPTSRRIITNIYNLQDLHDMNLYPCAYSMTFNVMDGKLNGMLNQRSQDMLTANNWNVVQYAILIHMLAQEAGLEAGELIHVIGDCHIYDRHISDIKALIDREPLSAPKLIINKEVHNFYDFKTSDFTLENYEYHPSIGKFEVAV